ncbi:patatin-like phospholipase family protein [Carboxylicivirga sp. N1Y90]|uniref:patatin-like phospholipase family protein n=1 Tax=Carboxylicivirga fragile TaxID=3417571 RepID=UPI003D330EA6|nr:patatin-like phospholipase family protein [Marinilabiliaceae bacterium N1Y90]
MKTVSLVLGSGGARGLAHIGVIRWLEEHGYAIKSIAGCSIGSLIGGVYAAGKMDELEEWMRGISKLDIADLLDISWGSGGFFKGDKIIQTLIKLLGDVQIEDLAIPYTAVAADIVTEKEVWINSGSLFDAIRASVSLPLFFTPVDYKGTKLVDGGVLNPVPIAPTFKDETDLTIAVNLGGEFSNDKEMLKNLSARKEVEVPSFQQSLMRFFSTKQKTSNEEKNQNWGMYDVADRAFDAMQSTIARQKIAAYPPDVEIVIARNACGTLEFDKAAEVIQLGYKKAELAFKDKL